MELWRPRPAAQTAVLVCSLALVFVFPLCDGFGNSGGGSGNPFQSSSLPSAELERCFCQLEGRIDDCGCDVDTVDHFNNMKIFPRLQSLLQKPYFKYFRYRADRPCPFWDTSAGKCNSPNCGVKNCKPEEIPPGLKGARPVRPQDKYSRAANEEGLCGEDDDLFQNEDDEDEEVEDKVLNSSVDSTISDADLANLEMWRDHDDAQQNFCDLDNVDELCPDCGYVDLTINPERFTGYSGEAAHRIWRAIYEENCFR